MKQMSDIMRICAVAVIAALCCAMLRQYSRDIALVLALAAGAMILLLSAQPLQQILQTVTQLTETAGLSTEIITPVVKTVGIGMVSYTSAEICRDAGERGLASFVEIGGSIAALLVTLPLLSAVLKLLGELI